jgi:hypothetical protein
MTIIWLELNLKYLPVLLHLTKLTPGVEIQGIPGGQQN